MNRTESIRQIVGQLDHLSDSDLEKVREFIRVLGRRPADEASSPPQPFVDEIERVKEQTQDIPGASDKRHFT